MLRGVPFASQSYPDEFFCSFRNRVYSKWTLAGIWQSWYSRETGMGYDRNPNKSYVGTF
jgi:hypothetical protein